MCIIGIEVFEEDGKYCGEDYMPKCKYKRNNKIRDLMSLKKM